MRNRILNAVLILSAYLLTCIAVFTGSYFQSALTVTVGLPSESRVVATRDVLNIVATDRNREEARLLAEALPRAVATLPDPSLNAQTNNNLYDFFYRLEGIRLLYSLWEMERDYAREVAYSQWRLQVEQWERHLVERAQMLAEGLDNVIGPSEPSEEFIFVYDEFPTEEQFASEPVRLSLAQQELLLNISDEELDDLYDALLLTAEAVLEPGVTEVNAHVLLAIQQKLAELIVDVADVGYEILASSIVPNMVFNEEVFLGRQEAIAEDYERVYVLQNEIIIGENERITEEAYAMMAELGMLEVEWTRDLVPLAGIFMLIAISMMACLWFIFFYRRRIISHGKEAMLVFTLYTSVLIVLWALDGVGYYFMPILAFTMLIAMLEDSRTALVLNLGFTVIAYFVVEGTMHYMLFFILSGTLMCLLARYTTERNKIMMVAVLAAFFNFILSIAISLAFDPHQAAYSMSAIVTVGAFAALNGLLTVIIAVGSLPLWEVLFGVVTPIKLLDLTNPANPLMRRLTIEAPGTYHHSLIVANLAESAAYDIGANPHIARAGGYYHDIGKLKYPQYFAENITGVSPHDDMDPLSSAQIIISHIAYGQTLAAEHRLPQFIRDIIYQHHGTSLIKFFYCKAKEMESSDDPMSKVEKSDYTYPFTIPQSREAAVVMLADGVEAAVRSMMAQGKDVGDMQGLINKMIKDKLSDGSLADSRLSIRDVDVIGKSFYRVLKGMYHERIPYPEEIDGEIMSRR